VVCKGAAESGVVVGAIWLRQLEACLCRRAARLPSVDASQEVRELQLVGCVLNGREGPQFPKGLHVPVTNL
jgi:hypothetical protein